MQCFRPACTRKHCDQIQSKTVAGGVAVGAASNMGLGPVWAMVIGLGSAVVSCLGFNLLQEFLEQKIKEGKLNSTLAYVDDKIYGLIASNNITDKIYFWQLYSILGEDPVHILIKRFYENIFNDSNAEWFRS